ncbi:hypothetical protein C8R47DRAFT_1193540 [Mycena vitilis]|nr:hypothetical protein C8R47DRAFT_1193540 [Mycena vitilis]
MARARVERAAYCNDGERKSTRSCTSFEGCFIESRVERMQALVEWPGLESNEIPGIMVAFYELEWIGQGLGYLRGCPHSKIQGKWSKHGGSEQGEACERDSASRCRTCFFLFPPTPPLALLAAPLRVKSLRIQLTNIRGVLVPSASPYLRPPASPRLKHPKSRRAVLSTRAALGLLFVGRGHVAVGPLPREFGREWESMESVGKCGSVRPIVPATVEVLAHATEISQVSSGHRRFCQFMPNHRLGQSSTSTNTGSRMKPHVAWAEEAYPASPRSVAHSYEYDDYGYEAEEKRTEGVRRRGSGERGKGGRVIARERRAGAPGWSSPMILILCSVFRRRILNAPPPQQAPAKPLATSMHLSRDKPQGYLNTPLSTTEVAFISFPLAYPFIRRNGGSTPSGGIGSLDLVKVKIDRAKAWKCAAPAFCEENVKQGARPIRRWAICGLSMKAFFLQVLLPDGWVGFRKALEALKREIPNCKLIAEGFFFLPPFIPPTKTCLEHKKVEFSFNTDRMRRSSPAPNNMIARTQAAPTVPTTWKCDIRSNFKQVGSTSDSFNSLGEGPAALRAEAMVKPLNGPVADGPRLQMICIRSQGTNRAGGAGSTRAWALLGQFMVTFSAPFEDLKR